MLPDGFGDAMADAVVWLTAALAGYTLATILFTGVGLGHRAVFDEFVVLRRK